jgi:hypothetical protein
LFKGALLYQERGVVMVNKVWTWTWTWEINGD